MHVHTIHAHTLIHTCILLTHRINTSFLLSLTHIIAHTSSPSVTHAHTRTRTHTFSHPHTPTQYVLSISSFSLCCGSTKEDPSPATVQAKGLTPVERRARELKAGRGVRCLRLSVLQGGSDKGIETLVCSVTHSFVPKLPRFPPPPPTSIPSPSFPFSLQSAATVKRLNTSMVYGPSRISPPRTDFPSYFSTANLQF